MLVFWQSKKHLDVPGSCSMLSNWAISPTYKWDILRLQPTDPDLLPALPSMCLPAQIETNFVSRDKDGRV